MVKLAGVAVSTVQGYLEGPRSQPPHPQIQCVLVETIHLESLIPMTLSPHETEGPKRWRRSTGNVRFKVAAGL